MYETLFNLIACLLADVLKYTPSECKDTVKKDYSDFLETQARKLLAGKIDKKYIFSDTGKCVSLQDFNDIIKICNSENNYLFSRSVLCLLDLYIDINELISKYDLNGFEDGLSNGMFESLNTNVDDTGIILIPRVPAKPQTFQVKNNETPEDKKYKNSNYWYDNLNEHFHNIIYVVKEKLGGYRIHNAVINLFKDRKKDKIIIGLTPGCNDSLDELMKLRELRDEKNSLQSFEVESYNNPKRLDEKYLKSLVAAKGHDVDILIGAEMLGTHDLCDADEIGYNKRFIDTSREGPKLIVTPSVWSDGNNYFSVFLNSGRLVGHQYKQHGFEYAHDGQRFEEALRNIPKEILLPHIPGFGRMAFLICVDFLVTEYRDMLVRLLKLDFMFCPSYSDGVYQFADCACAVRGFGTRFVWINSCSALRKYSKVPSYVGLVSTPLKDIDNIELAAQKIAPKCNGECFDGCLFTVTIQLESKDGIPCNDVKIEHITL